MCFLGYKPLRARDLARILGPWEAPQERVLRCRGGVGRRGIFEALTRGWNHCAPKRGNNLQVMADFFCRGAEGWWDESCGMEKKRRSLQGLNGLRKGSEGWRGPRKTSLQRLCQRSGQNSVLARRLGTLHKNWAPCLKARKGLPV